MEKEKKRSFAVLGDSYDNEPFIFNCKWIEGEGKERDRWNFGKNTTPTQRKSALATAR